MLKSNVRRSLGKVKREWAAKALLALARLLSPRQPAELLVDAAELADRGAGILWRTPARRSVRQAIGILDEVTKGRPVARAFTFGASA